MANRYLEHYGVLGMKWGRRRLRQERARATLRKRVLTDKDYRKSIYLHDAGKSAVISGLLTFGLNKALGVSTSSSASTAAKAAVAGAAISAALNKIGEIDLRLMDAAAKKKG